MAKAKHMRTPASKRTRTPARTSITQSASKVASKKALSKSAHETYLAEHRELVVYTPVVSRPEAQRDQLTQAEWHKITKYVKHSLSENTQRAYKAAWADFSFFCQDNCLSALPATPSTIALYLSTLAEGKDGYSLKKSTIAARVAAISSIHELHFGLSDAEGVRYENPAHSNLVKRTLAGIVRHRKVQKARQVQAATQVELRLMCDAIQAAAKHEVTYLRDKALLLVGFAGAFRRSELVGIQRGDIRLDNDGMLITLPFSKTDQTGAGAVKEIDQADDVALCPVIALQNWLRVANIQPNDRTAFVFRGINRWGHIASTPLDARSVALIVQRAAVAAGLDASQFAGHSLRAGFVTDALSEPAHKKSEIEIMHMTGHKSVNTLKRYYRPRVRRGVTR